MSKSDLFASLQRQRNKNRSLVERSKAVGRRAIGVGITVAGGGVSGVTRAFLPTIPGTDLPTDGVGGAVIALLGAALGEQLGDEAADAMVLFGGSMAAPAVSRAVDDMLSSK